jgi:hypothetical protein
VPPNLIKRTIACLRIFLQQKISFGACLFQLFLLVLSSFSVPILEGKPTQFRPNYNQHQDQIGLIGFDPNTTIHDQFSQCIRQNLSLVVQASTLRILALHIQETIAGDPIPT